MNAEWNKEFHEEQQGLFQQGCQAICKGQKCQILVLHHKGPRQGHVQTCQHLKASHREEI
eukprot:12897661-Prorocentrum_lima.AAC.1